MTLKTDTLTDEQITSFNEFVAQRIGDDSLSPEHREKLFAEWATTTAAPEAPQTWKPNDDHIGLAKREGAEWVRSLDGFVISESDILRIIAQRDELLAVVKAAYRYGNFDDCEYVLDLLNEAIAKMEGRNQ
jgi:hypothetical protein